ncbi:regulatory protein [Anaerosolibacter carboniphilus]|uniref:Regulatory protein RecX n=1 Tax=Anaerosolibacter carboniphilus TaxID=1417629 RepID=A0A841KND8_9FIRM|nr:RecX family transcriptional regulator [Anaerosolibacter carboniphilus]MBB6215314.1 regulatory protein [Anaerosolibacter carboniphilus]
MSEIHRGIITKIEQQEKNKGRYSIYVDHQFAFGISEDLLVKYRLLKGKEIDPASMETIIEEEEQNKANHYALKLLSFRGRTRQEVEKKMKEKEYEAPTIEKTLAFLQTHNYINDEDFAASYIRDKVNIQKLGKMRIKQELYQKGIDKTTVQEAINEQIDPIDEFETALDLGRKKLNSTYRNDDKNAQYRKLGSFLQRRGYDYDIIKKVLNTLVK